MARAKAVKPLTRRQRQVFDLLDAGKTPAEVAEALNTSATNVYGHMRKIKDHGYKIPRSVGRKRAARKRTRKPRATAQSNGQPNGAARMDGPPEHITRAVEAVKEAIDIETKRAKDHESRIQTLRDELEVAETEAHQTVAEMKRLENARNDLTGTVA